MESKAVLIDFDSTATKINVLDTLYENFGDLSYHIYMERWSRGEISTKEEIESIFATFTASRDEMEFFLTTIELDPGLNTLIEVCRKDNIEFAIVSDGLRWYIDFILEHNHLYGIKVYASELIFKEDGFEFEYPWSNPAYPLRSTAKPEIVKRYQSKDLKVIFVGDGLSDVEVLGIADIVFAKDALLENARLMGNQVNIFEDLIDVVRYLDGC